MFDTGEWFRIIVLSQNSGFILGLLTVSENNPFDMSECKLLCKNKYICVNLQFFLVMVGYFCDQVASCFSTVRLGYFMHLRWFETVFYFPFQLNFMKGLLICSKRLLLLLDSQLCYNNLSTYQLNARNRVYSRACQVTAVT